MRCARRSPIAALGMRSQSSTPDRRDKMNQIFVAAHDAGLADIVGDNPIAALLLQLLLGVLDQVFGLGGEADHQAWPLRVVRQRRQYVRVFDQRERRGLAVPPAFAEGMLLQLGVCGRGDAPVCDGGGEHGDIDR